MRPYANLNIDDLEKLFTDHPHNAKVLQAVFRELDYRSTERAKKLKAQLGKRISRLKSELTSLFHEVPAQSSDEATTAHTSSFNPSFMTLESDEKDRLAGLYSGLRDKLLDLTKRNRMLNYSVKDRAKNQLQFVDEVPEEVYSLMAAGAPMTVVPLPEPDIHPEDEKTAEFLTVLDHAKVADAEYVEAVEQLVKSETDDDVAMQQLERKLRDKLRKQLEMPERPKRKDINRLDYARGLGIRPAYDLSPSPRHDGHSDKNLQTIKYPDELESILERVRQQARLAEEESGLSTLFLAFGFLEWYESDSSERAYYAPLLLLPVKVAKSTPFGKPVFKIEAREEAAETNVSLQKYLHTMHGRQLPSFGEEDDSSTIESYFRKVTESIEGLKRWRVRRYMILGHFAFSRIAIYEDTNPERWAAHPVAHKLVGPLLSGYEMDEDDGPDDAGSGIASPPDYDIEDIEIEALAPILVQDADASQHSALIDVMKGKNLVIQGPPGTGKSQTITNVIANALHANKTVLFLADKRAALEVVKRRLDRADLGDFCLELHSDKSTPRAVMDSLQTRIGLHGQVPNVTSEDRVWRETRENIRAYLDELHELEEDGASVFNLIWRALRMQSDDPALMGVLSKIDIPQTVLSDHEERRVITGRLEQYTTASNIFIENHGPFHKSPWSETPPRDIAPYDIGEFFTSIEDFAEAAKALHAYPSTLAALGVETIDHLDVLLRAHDTRPSVVPDREGVNRIKHIERTGLQKALDAQFRVLELTEALASMPRHDDVTGDSLDRAVCLSAALPPEDQDKPPRQFFEEADIRIGEAKTFADLLKRLEPAFGILGIRGGETMAHLEAASRLIELAGEISESKRNWIVQSVAKPNRARDLVALHGKLVEEERQLVTVFTHCRRDTWPVQADIDTLIASLESAGLGKMMQALSGKTRAATLQLEAMGYIGQRSDAAQHLRRLTAHKQAVAFFLSDENAEAIGDAWRGLATPFDVIAYALGIRDKIDAALAGAEVEGLPDRFLSLQPGDLAFLSTHAQSAASATPRLSALKNLPLTGLELFTNLNTLIQNLESRLAFDPERSLAATSLSIRTCANIARVRAEMDRLVSKTFHGEAGQFIADHIRTNDDIVRARDAIAWLNWIADSKVVEPFAADLTKLESRAPVECLTTVSKDVRKLKDRLSAAIESLSSFGLDGLGAMPLDQAITQTDSLLAHRRQFIDWQSLRRQRRGLEESGLQSLLSTADKNGIVPDRLAALLEALVARRRVVNGRRKSAKLSFLRGSEVESKRRSFAERDRRKIDEDRSRVKAALLKRPVPQGNRRGPIKSFTEMALIRNELTKQRNLVKVRALLSRAGRSIQQMKPCFMMSPLSLSKFMPAGEVEFDLLVIDEASQMRPEDALGAMMRSRQIVVVGDEKQLPPTSFFDRSETPDDDSEIDDEPIDDESILERCQKVFNEVRGLKWHYRSRCESLIRFSNDHFYRNELITFPAAKPEAFSVDLVRVNGNYQTRRNPIEAERISEETVEFMRHFAGYPIETIPSLGIVAVNTDQRDLISETLRRYAANDELVEEFMAKIEDKGEPLFVKNLENVQGDERDFIFISMTYGPEPGQTRTKQRFGPINSKTGHRRLNVLFSRARMRLALFTSFGSEDVTPTETSQQGVHVLKQYLEYAESKGRVAADLTSQEADSDFEIEVARRLRAHGYEVDLQVGVTGYRIDVGVRHPDAPHIFLAGVECDGASYHSSKSARDRDRLREEVLGGLGWRLLRIWSTDWFDDPDAETEKLIRRLEALRSQTPSSNSDYRLVQSYVAREGEDAQIVGGALQPELTDVGPQQLKLDALGEQAIDLQETDITANGEAHVADPPPSATPKIAVPHEQDGTMLLEGSDPLTAAEAQKALAAMREKIIAARIEGWEPHRSILRDSMIETFISQRITDPEQWFNKVPAYLRTGTDPREKKLFMEDICDVVSRLN